MTEKPKAVRKRKTRTQLLISEESKAALRTWLDSDEGQRRLDEFARLIAEWAAKAMPTELLRALGTREDLETLKELWPKIVDAYFKAICASPRKRPPIHS
jgi:hypothetical protein